MIAIDQRTIAIRKLSNCGCTAVWTLCLELKTTIIQQTRYLIWLKRKTLVDIVQLPDSSIEINSNFDVKMRMSSCNINIKLENIVLVWENFDDHHRRHTRNATSAEEVNATQH